jgi:3-oxoacyl-[acyl-carrier protein] reductase
MKGGGKAAARSTAASKAPASKTAPRRTSGKARAETVLVTGSARRLGRALALRFAAQGCFVFIHYLGSRREAAATLQAVEATGGKGALVHGDLSTPAGVEALAAEVRAQAKRLDVLVNNVGMYQVGPLETFAPADFELTLQVNLSAPFRLVQALSPLMPRGARVVNIGYAGLDNLTATTHNTAYLVSKTGLLVLTKSLAQALGPRGIRVNMVSPGILSNSVELPERASDYVPLGTLGDVNDVSDAVAFLCGREARYITGVNLDVAGGYHLGLRSLEHDGRARDASKARSGKRGPR